MCVMLIPLINRLFLTSSAPPKNKSVLNARSWSVVLSVPSYPVTISCGVMAPLLAPLQVPTLRYRLLSASTYREFACKIKHFCFILQYFMLTGHPSLEKQSFPI